MCFIIGERLILICLNTLVIPFPAGESLGDSTWPVKPVQVFHKTLTTPREMQHKRSLLHLKEHSSYRTMILSLEVLRCQRTVVLGISFAALLVLSQQNRSHIKVKLNLFSG